MLKTGTLHILLLSLAVLFAVSSCRQDPSKSLKGKNQVNTVDYEYFSARGKVKFKEGLEETKGVAHVRMKSDSIVWMSMRTGTGIEGLRMVAYPDSIFIVDVIHKEYYAMSFASLSEKIKFDIDLKTIQSILTGNPILIPNRGVRKSSSDKYLTLTQSIEDIKVQSKVLIANRRLENVNVSNTFTLISLLIDYKEFEDFDGVTFPKKAMVHLKYPDASDKFDINIDIDYGKVVTSSTPLKFPLRIPEKYTLKELK
ncbi:DUF4292 domain-containing protein [Flammeovirgaceae bacterium SG7u.111]|nr:DUF4292 domain-containing protein [Flammeovirgaceae bacterium SG7u.132]WPO38458.1 DUF4292 domain-containing protein [Flammeovirgaceae bacterium SG7u.111]